MSHQILSRMFSRQLFNHKEFASKSICSATGLIRAQDVCHFSCQRLNRPGKSFWQNVLVAGGLVVGGGVTVAAAAYQRYCPALSAMLNAIPSPILKRSYCAQAAGDASKDASSLPGWTPESQDLYHHYMAELIPRGWKKVLTSVGRERNQALFTLNHPEIGATFEYVVFYNEEERKSITLVQFGPKTQGPPGFVHGGAIATAGDICAGIFLSVGMHCMCMTANLTVNYKRPLPLGSTVVVETEIEKIEGRKYFTFSTFKSPDGSILYDTVNTLFIQIKSLPK